tara:strand:+ start:573 stop:728 length:156 start_codon:yes stop_codon:yes gene_type:complete
MRDPQIEIVVSGKNSDGNEVVLKKASSEANAKFVYEELLEILTALTSADES